MINRRRGLVVLPGLLLVTTLSMSACGDSDQSRPPSSMPAGTSTAPSSQSRETVPIAKQKKVLKPSECGGLLTVADVQSAVGFPAHDSELSRPGFCGVTFQESTVLTGLADVSLTLDDSEPADRVIDVAGNYATERDENSPGEHQCTVRVRVAQVSKEQPGGTLRVAAVFNSEQGKAKDVCAITRSLAKTAFDRLPDA